MQSMDWLFKKDRIFLLAQFWQQRASLAEKEVNQLREQLAVANQNTTGQDSVTTTKSGNDMEKAIDLIARSSVEMEIAAKEKEISQLLEDVQRLQTTLKQLRETSAAQIAQLEEQLEKRDNQIQQLQNKLDGQRDYEDIKRELSILRSIEFANIVPNVASSTKSLETLLLEKTKSLQNENTSLKLSNSDLSGTGNPSHLALMRMLPFSPLFQNVDSFGTVLGEEIVGSWRRMLERTAFSQGISHSNGLSPRSPSEPTSPSSDIKPEPPQSVNTNSGVGTPTTAGDSGPLINGVSDLTPPCGTGSPASGSSEDRPTKLETGNLTFGESLIPKGDPMEARLQEMLRRNMEKYANQNLDTFYISRRVRELLSIHNIGQRVFAKYILGLSQGTVSELLSKPKPWDKLTEKGRDSYRKMHGWACDDAAVYFLKSLIPKKGEGKDSAMSPFKAEDMGAEERIASILSEASQALKSQQGSEGSDGARSPASSQSPPLSKESLKRLKKYENDDIPPEKVLRIYQDELAKLMGRPMDDLSRLSGMQHWPSVLFPFFGGSLPSRQPDDIQMALNIYHQELTKFSAAHMLNGVAQDLSVPKKEKDSSDGSEERKEESESMRHSGSAFTLVRPKQEVGSATQSGSPAANILSMVSVSEESQTNPLQRMQSITNSLISQPSAPSLPMPSPRPLKAVLPPITQYQFDKYQNLNTEDIVKKVKEQLSQYSISQRLFGESVLGLSQGSVSDLLARPKPWHMLTQKGREPFIRMKIFLEDDNAVHKLVASQYKIAPEKLMRTGGYGTSPKMMHPKVSESPVNHPASLESPLPPTSLATSLAHMQLSQHGFTGENSLRSQFLQETLKKNHSLRPGHVQPSVYEMAALTQDLDTQLITTKIKETLLANNIGQKLFGEAVLGLSQGSVSELLSKPKPWHMLSIKGREPFIRMQLWLNDPHNVERLQQMKNERREANKRRRSQIDINDSSNESGDIYNSMTSSPGSGINATKKQRVLFSEEQKEALRLAFALDPYPNMATIEFLGEDLGLNARTITNWFHNHRMRLKQQIPHGSEASLALSSSREGQSFDPVQFRLLLNQRLLELRKDRSGLGGLAGSLNFPYFASGLQALHKEQMNGLDLTMERPASEYNEDQDNDSDNFSVDSPKGMMNDYSNVSGDESESKSDDRDHESVKTPISEGNMSFGISQTGFSRSSRRKPAAPQWVNPDWQAEVEAKTNNNDEVIINGVCVMQTDPYVMGRPSEETIRIDPTPVDMSESPGRQIGDKEALDRKSESPELDKSDSVSTKSLPMSDNVSDNVSVAVLDTMTSVTDSLVEPR